MLFPFGLVPSLHVLVFSEKTFLCPVTKVFWMKTSACSDGTLKNQPNENYKAFSDMTVTMIEYLCPTNICTELESILHVWIKIITIMTTFYQKKTRFYSIKKPRNNWHLWGEGWEVFSVPSLHALDDERALMMRLLKLNMLTRWTCRSDEYTLWVGKVYYMSGSSS